MKSDFFDRSILRRQLWLFRKEFLWVGVFSIIANILMLTPSLYMLQVYDRVMKSGNQVTLLFVTIFLVIFFGAMAVAEWLRSRLLVRAGVRMDEGINSMVFNASFDAWLDRAGDRAHRALNDLTTIRQFLTANGIIAFFDTPWTPIYIVVIFILSPFLGWISILFSLIQLGMTVLTSWLSSREIETAAEAGNESYRFVQGKLRNIEPIHAMGMTASLRERWFDLHDAALERSGRSQESQHRLQAITKFVRYCMQSLTLGAGGLMVIEGKMSAGSMIAANLLMSRALQPLDLVVATWKPFIQAREAFGRLEGLLEAFPARNAGSRPGKKPLGEVVLDGLEATVPGRKEPNLKGLDARIPPGNVIVVVGPSGSGKSTLARCILGIWPGHTGQVLLDGEPIEEWDREELGPHIGYLPQDIELFDGTIADNIARFSEVDPEKVIEAAQRTGIHEMVLRFPKGYDTTIGEAGGMLSGGQRQRLGLARAIYGNPSLVVLDEPNANLDDAGERALVHAVRELKDASRTVVLITHRPSIIAVADYLLVMQDGAIRHFGTRDAVLEEMRPKAVPVPQPAAG